MAKKSNRHRCQKRIEGKRCILPIGHTDDHFTRVDLMNLTVSRCSSYNEKPGGGNHWADWMLSNGDQCVKWKGHRGHHLFETELAEDKAEPDVFKPVVTLLTVSVGRGGLKFATGGPVKPTQGQREAKGPVVFRSRWIKDDLRKVFLPDETHRCDHVERVARWNADATVRTQSKSRCSKWAGHHGDHGFMFEAEEGDEVCFTETRPSEPVRSDSTFDWTQGDTSMIFEVGGLGGCHCRFDPPVRVKAGDLVTVVMRQDGADLTVAHTDGSVAHHHGVADARPAEPLQSPLVPPESEIARDERYTGGTLAAGGARIPVAVPPPVPPEEPNPFLIDPLDEDDLS